MDKKWKVRYDLIVRHDDKFVTIDYSYSLSNLVDILKNLPDKSKITIYKNIKFC